MPYLYFSSTDHLSKNTSSFGSDLCYLATLNLDAMNALVAALFFVLLPVSQTFLSFASLLDAAHNLTVSQCNR